MAITDDLINKASKAIELATQDIANQDKLLMGPGDVDIERADGTKISGPSWPKLVKGFNDANLPAFTALAQQVRDDKTSVDTNTAAIALNTSSAANSAATATTQADIATAKAAVANTGAATATAQATTATTQADRAKAEADRAQTANPDNQLKKAQNLADLPDKAAARTNLQLDRLQQFAANTQLKSPDGNVRLTIDNGTWSVYNDSKAAAVPLGIGAGGTGATDAAGARTNLGVNLLVQDATETSIRGPNGNYRVIVGNAAGWGCYDAGAKTWSALGIAQGGTGAVTAGAARTNLALDRFVQNPGGDTEIYNSAGSVRLYLRTNGGWGVYDAVNKKAVALPTGAGGTGADNSAQALKNLMDGHGVLQLTDTGTPMLQTLKNDATKPANGIEVHGGKVGSSYRVNGVETNSTTLHVVKKIGDASTVARIEVYNKGTGGTGGAEQLPYFDFDSSGVSKFPSYNAGIAYSGMSKSYPADNQGYGTQTQILTGNVEGKPFWYRFRNSKDTYTLYQSFGVIQQAEENPNTLGHCFTFTDGATFTRSWMMRNEGVLYSPGWNSNGQNSLSFNHVGNVNISDMVNTSDRRLKDNIEDYDGAQSLEMICGLDFKTFVMKDDEAQCVRRGIIAQEAPEDYVNDNGEVLYLNNNQMLMDALAAIKVLSGKVVALEKQLFESVETNKQEAGGDVQESSI